MSAIIITPIDKLNILQVITRDWNSSLSNTEFRIVTFIYDRTIAWGKLSENIPRDHFLKGIPGVTAPLPISRWTLMRTMANLIDRGVVLCLATGLGRGHMGRYQLNLEWKPKNASLAKEAEMSLRVSKRRLNHGSIKGCMDAPEKGAPVHHKRVQNRAYIIRERNRGKETGKVSVAPEARGSLEDDGDIKSRIERHLEPTRERYRSSVAQKLMRGATTGDWFAIWRNAVLETFPDVRVVAWTKVQLAMIKRVARRVDDFAKVLDWVPRNWIVVIKAQFAWMRRPAAPAVPTIRFFLAFADTWITAFSERLHRKAIFSAPDAEREYRQLLDQGMTHDDALLKLAERRVRAKDREKQDKREIELKRREDAVRVRERNIVRDTVHVRNRKDKEEDRPRRYRDHTDKPMRKTTFGDFEE